MVSWLPQGKGARHSDLALWDKGAWRLCHPGRLGVITEDIAALDTDTRRNRRQGAGWAHAPASGTASTTWGPASL